MERDIEKPERRITGFEREREKPERSIGGFQRDRETDIRMKHLREKDRIRREE